MSLHMRTLGVRRIGLLSLIFILSACGGGGGGGDGGTPMSGGSPPNTGNQPRFAYVANQGDGTVSVYAVDAASGQLRSRGYVPAGSTPQFALQAVGGISLIHDALMFGLLHKPDPDRRHLIVGMTDRRDCGSVVPWTPNSSRPAWPSSTLLTTA